MKYGNMKGPYGQVKFSFIVFILLFHGSEFYEINLCQSQVGIKNLHLKKLTFFYIIVYQICRVVHVLSKASLL